MDARSLAPLLPVICRYHRYLYDRMCTAKRCCEQKNQPLFRQTGEARREDDEAGRQEEAERLHGQFMTLLREVLTGKIDSSTFEDSCRSLLGTNSYVLFTLDKLIHKLVKHMQVRGSNR